MGLNPHILLEAIYFQITSVAKVRTTDPSLVSNLVDQHLEGRELSCMGESWVNLLNLNLALDAALSH